MRLSFLGVVLLSVFVPLISVYATENTELLDEVQQLDAQQIQLDDLKFQTFSSCDEMSATLTTFVKENFDYWYARPVPYSLALAEDSVSAEAVANPAGAGVGKMDAVRDEAKSIASSTTDFSTTNIQVAGVDEPEILKSDGEHLYYYNQRFQKVFIIVGPLDRATSTISMARSRVVSIIALPSTFGQAQLFIRGNQLILLAQRYTNLPQAGLLDRSSRTDVVVYDITTRSAPKLLKFAEFDGWYQDARLIKNTLYVVSQVGINRRWYGQQGIAIDDIAVQAQDLMPKTIDISYTTEASKKNLVLDEKTYPYHVSSQSSSCAEMYYVLPTKKSIQTYGLSPQFTLLRAIDLDLPTQEPKTTTTFGSTQTMHLTDKAVYLASSFWAPYNSPCPADARCIRGGGGEQQTLLHKLSLQGTAMSYVSSVLLPGSPLTQRSMDEDAGGNFRILTSTRSPQQATHLITLDKTLKQLGSLLNIEPGEQFKASRFMGDKLYLVTFEQIDPLFVVDLTNLALPKIIGELKIPGYSTYLHPYSEEKAGVQWLLGIGYDTTVNQRGGTQTSGIKIDLYKVDYTKKDASGNIAVTQEVSKTFGGKGSDSEALQNPRLFVWNSTTKQLVLPMVLQNVTTGKQCTTTYDTNGKVIGENCRDNENYTTSFAGMKLIEVLQKEINEVASYDYTDLLKKDTQTYDSYQGQIWPRQLTNLQFRVGYLGDVLYTINNLFTHFVVPGKTGQEMYIHME